MCVISYFVFISKRR